MLELLVLSTLLASSGRIEGELRHANGALVAGAVVQIVETSEVVVSDENGRFAFEGLERGSYTLSFSLGPHASDETVVVEAETTAVVRKIVDWEGVFFESVTVTSAARRRQGITEAQAAITPVGVADIDRRAARSDVPQLFEFTPGVELTQEDIGGYNFNSRGFNNTLTRRVAVFVDGRSNAQPFLGSQNWGVVSFPLDDIASAEFVRGPSAALYGVNASSGVINLTSRSPRDYPGLRFRFAVGERDTTNADFRFATELGDGWFLKVVGLARRAKTFAVSRHESVEYSAPCAPGQFADCLPLDPFEVEADNTSGSYGGGVRFDKYFANDALLSLEGGTARAICCGVSATGAGRFLLPGGGGFSWARINLDIDRWTVLAYLNGTGGPASGTAEDGRVDNRSLHLEARKTWTLGEGLWNVVAGALYENNRVDAFSALPIDTHRQAAYAQVERKLGGALDVAVAGRVENDTIHDPQFSPRVSLLWTLRPGHTLRFGYNQAFQAPALVEYFLKLDVAAPADLGALEGFCGAHGVSCGLGPTPVRAVGNPNLDVERVQSFEVGYRGLLGSRTFISADFFVGDNQKFITNLLPQIGTPLGRLNASFGPWTGPIEAESTPVIPSTCPTTDPSAVATVGDCVRAVLPGLSNDPEDGTNVIPAVTFTNFGNVDTRGLELGATHVVSGSVRLNVSASWFDATFQESLPGFEDLLLPNAPEWQAAVGAGYSVESWQASVAIRWVDAFRWSTGVFVGDVESYTTADLDASYRLARDWSVGVTVTNLFNDEHYEFFGAPNLSRRALVHFTYNR